MSPTGRSLGDKRQGLGHLSGGSAESAEYKIHVSAREGHIARSISGRRVPGPGIPERGRASGRGRGGYCVASKGKDQMTCCVSPEATCASWSLGGHKNIKP
jgi:hypothetical protein